jgi:hypothetical protein
MINSMSVGLVSRPTHKILNKIAIAVNTKKVSEIKKPKCPANAG